MQHVQKHALKKRTIGSGTLFQAREDLLTELLTTVSTEVPWQMGLAF